MKRDTVEEKEKIREAKAKPKKAKLSYKDKLELEGMEPKIMALEAEAAALQAESMKPEHAANAKKLMRARRERKETVGPSVMPAPPVPAGWSARFHARRR